MKSSITLLHLPSMIACHQRAISLWSKHVPCVHFYTDCSSAGRLLNTILPAVLLRGRPYQLLAFSCWYWAQWLWCFSDSFSSYDSWSSFSFWNFFVIWHRGASGCRPRRCFLSLLLRRHLLMHSGCPHREQAHDDLYGWRLQLPDSLLMPSATQTHLDHRHRSSCCWPDAVQT